MKKLLRFMTQGLCIAIILHAIPMHASQPPEQPWWRKWAIAGGVVGSVGAAAALAYKRWQQNHRVDANERLLQPIKDGDIPGAGVASKAAADANEQLLQAVKDGNIPAAEAAIKAGADVNWQYQGIPMLQLAFGNNDMLVLLLRYGATADTSDLGVALFTESIERLRQLCLSHRHMLINGDGYIVSDRDFNKLALLLSFRVQVHLAIPAGTDLMALLKLTRHIPANQDELGDLELRLTQKYPEEIARLKIIGRIPSSSQERAQLIRDLSPARREDILQILKSHVKYKEGPLVLEDLQQLAALGDQKAQKEIEQLAKGFEHKLKVGGGLPGWIIQRFNPYVASEEARYFEKPATQQEENAEVEPGIQPLDIEDESSQVELKDLDALMHAALIGDASTVESMLSTQDVNAHATNLNNLTPLIIASAGGHIDVVRLLLDRGADILAVDSKDNNALAMAIRRNRTEVARLLIEHAKSNGKLKDLVDATRKKLSDNKDMTDRMNKIVGQFVDLNAE